MQQSREERNLNYPNEQFYEWKILGFIYVWTTRAVAHMPFGFFYMKSKLICKCESCLGWRRLCKLLGWFFFLFISAFAYGYRLTLYDQFHNNNAVSHTDQMPTSRWGNVEPTKIGDMKTIDSLSNSSWWCTTAEKIKYSGYCSIAVKRVTASIEAWTCFIYVLNCWYSNREFNEFLFR